MTLILYPLAALAKVAQYGFGARIELEYPGSEARREPKRLKLRRPSDEMPVAPGRTNRVGAKIDDARFARTGQPFHRLCR